MMRRIAWALVLCTIAAAAPTARASHPTQLCLDIEPDTQGAAYNDDIVEFLRAYPGATDASHPPEHEGCVTELVEPGQDWGGTNIDFELTGAGDPDSSDTPTSPDVTCSVPAGSASCSISVSSTEEGTQAIRGWTDSDLSDATVEADMTEGQDEATAPGESPEPDRTDVASRNWYRAQSSVQTTVTIAFDETQRLLHGKARSQHSLCRSSRDIKLFRRHRDASRTLVQTTATDDEGAWELPDFHPKRGRFYAVAPVKEINDLVGTTWCLRDSSKTLLVRR